MMRNCMRIWLRILYIVENQYKKHKKVGYKNKFL